MSAFFEIFLPEPGRCELIPECQIVTETDTCYACEDADPQERTVPKGEECPDEYYPSVSERDAACKVEERTCYTCPGSIDPEQVEIKVPIDESCPSGYFESETDRTAACLTPEVTETIFGNRELCGNGIVEGAEQCDLGRKNVWPPPKDLSQTYCDIFCRSPECSDGGIDNDGDGPSDAGDPGCYDATKQTLLEQIQEIVGIGDVSGPTGQYLPGKSLESCPLGQQKGPNACESFSCVYAPNVVDPAVNCASPQNCGDDERCIAACTCSCRTGQPLAIRRVQECYDGCMQNDAFCGDREGAERAECCRQRCVGAECSIRDVSR